MRNKQVISWFIIVQLTHNNYYKIVKLLKSLKIITVAQRVSVYINHHQGALSLCFAKVTMLTSVTNIVM